MTWCRTVFPSAAILRSDFYSFVQAAFPIVSGGEELLRNWHLEAMAYALTRVMRGEIRRLIINVPPRSLKSICASVAFPAFLLGHDPTLRIICVSYAEALARKHAGDTRALMRSPLYRRLFPGTRISPRKDTELEFMTTKGGFRLATSVGGTLTGRGGGLVILDDPMKPQDAYSETARETVKQWYAAHLLSRLDNKAEDGIIVVMQRLHVDDLVGHLLEQEGWTLLKLPAIAQSDETTLLGPDRCYVRLAGRRAAPRARAPLRTRGAEARDGLGRFLRPISARAGAADRQSHQLVMVPGLRRAPAMVAGRQRHRQHRHGDERKRTRRLFGSRRAP